MKKSMLFRGVALIAVAIPSATYAQSSGSVDFDEEEIVVTATTSVNGVGGVVAPDTGKAKAVLTQEFISRSNPGQTILDTINQIPAVNFQNNDAYGSSGGTLNIRGFGSDRIALTFDGVPLNDSGNYAIYSSQQVDAELIEQVNVSLGTTDIDSPTASAAGGTVNYRTRKPNEEFGARLQGSFGDFNFMRVFGVVDTGNLTSSGLRAFVSASTASNRNPFNNYGRVRKQQYNAKLYQPVGDNGDFVSVSGHYNQGRNNFFGSLPLRTDAGRVVGSGSSNRYPTNNDEREYLINYPCQTNTVARPGQADAPNTCGTEYDRRYNPSNTGNIRGQSQFSFGEKITLNIDPSYQYVKANGGGTVTAREAAYDANSAGGRANCATTANGAQVTCVPGYLGGSPYFGRDLNGDGDLLDTLTMIAPSQTQTHRYIVNASLRYEINDDHSVRLIYLYDRARHRQTGEVGAVMINGEPFDVFPGNDGLADASGSVLQKRDRKSYAILQQIGGEYRGEFGPLLVKAGVRAPFYKRDLNQYCYTSSASGFVDCFGSNAAAAAAYAAANPASAAPQRRIYKYDKILPNVEARLKLGGGLSIFGSYSQGISVPGTDPLYSSLYYPATNAAVRPAPETTHSFDAGARFTTNQVQAQLTGWMTKYKNRLASAFDPDLNETVYRNLGNVDKWGIDGSISYRPIPEALFYVFGAWNDSEIKNDVAVNATTVAPTAGKRESGAPTFSFGGSVQGTLGPVELGLTAKRTGPRYVFDTNLPVFARINNVNTQVYGAKAAAYTLVNLDAKVNLSVFGLNEKSFFQLNVYNLFDKFYVGGFGGGLYQNGVYSTTPTATSIGSPPFVQIGAPRTISATISFEY